MYPPHTDTQRERDLIANKEKKSGNKSSTQESQWMESWQLQRRASTWTPAERIWLKKARAGVEVTKMGREAAVFGKPLSTGNQYKVPRPLPVGPHTRYTCSAVKEAEPRQVQGLAQGCTIPRGQSRTHI